MLDRPWLPCLTLALALVLAPASGAVELVAACPEGCGIEVDISRIESGLTADGRFVEASYEVVGFPADLKLRKVIMSAEVTLENGKVLEGSKDLGPDSKSRAKIEVKGGFLDLNKGRRVKATRAKVKVAVFSELKPSAGPKLVVTSARTHTMVGPTVAVGLQFPRGPNPPCDTATGIRLRVKAKTDKGATLEGEETFPLSIGMGIVTLKGLGKRRADSLEDIEATARFAGRTDVVCVEDKTRLLDE